MGMILVRRMTRSKRMLTSSPFTFIGERALDLGFFSGWVIFEWEI